MIPNTKLIPLVSNPSWPLQSQIAGWCAGFVFLNSLTGLTELTVGACSVTSFHLCMATALTNLESLNLPLNRGIDDASVGDIAATFPQLTHLDLTETA